MSVIFPEWIVNIICISGYVPISDVSSMFMFYDVLKLNYAIVFCLAMSKCIIFYQVVSKPYQAASGAELTKLCNHKRKLLATLQARAQSPATPPPHNIEPKKGKLKFDRH